MKSRSQKNPFCLNVIYLTPLPVKLSLLSLKKMVNPYWPTNTSALLSVYFYKCIFLLYLIILFAWKDLWNIWQKLQMPKI